MDTSISLLQDKLKEIKDFRSARGQGYKLYNLLAILILANIAGADDFEAVAAFVIGKKDYLQKRHLIDGKRFPSHDIFRWVLQKLDRTAFSQLLSAWLEYSISITPTPPRSEPTLAKEEAYEPPPEDRSAIKKMLHIDGKSLRATPTSQHSRTALQIVNAYCSDMGITIGQLIIDKKSCEKTAIPQLIDLLYLKDTVITIDAIATTKKNAAKIIDKEADYVLALKKNNKILFLEVESFFKHFEDTSLIKDYAQTIELKTHGRTEIRSCSIISDLQFFPDAQDWKNLKSIVCIEAQRTTAKKSSIQRRYYLSSLEPNAKQLQEAIRRHWSVENELHWSLDVAFNEDKSRLRDKNAAANFAAIRRFALAIVKNAGISKESAKTQRLQAAWSEQFLDDLFKIFEKIILII